MKTLNQCSPKKTRNFMFGAIFIGFLLNCAVFIVSSIFGLNEIYASPLPTYLVLSIIAGIIWMRDGDGKHESQAIIGFTDGLGFKRDGHGPIAIGIGLLLLLLGVLVLLGNGIAGIFSIGKTFFG